MLKELFDINGTLGYDLWYPNNFLLMIAKYSNTDQEKNVEDRKSTFGAFFFYYW